MNVYPGKEIDFGQDCLLGHGTYKALNAQGEEVALATVTGEIQQVDRLITVRSASHWYTPYTGDVVVGQITAIANKRWYVEINSKAEAVLMLTAINLEGNVQRRKGELDEIKMKEYYGIGDIIIAEVQSTGNKIQLHTRNERYTKIPYGLLLKLSPNDITKEKTQIQTIPIDNQTITVISGMNGYVAIYGPPNSAQAIKQVAQSILALASDNSHQHH
ncbi:exosome complex component RRP4 [Nematocida homosporus]|uniref:exosome complex component RRP4 n=1 Tax=Nematocida homosporus TaxID=1912981 RepID=UPI00221E3A90|nr:exosome complex component RRP4 [Nematocida homosporus]KAI5184558.1 exosome complex component RRP4 [Nematocida homosporus]